MNIQFTTDIKDVSASAIRSIADAFENERHLLRISTFDIANSMDAGLAAVAFIDQQAVGFTRLIPLVGKWWELGSTWVHINFRNQGVNHRLYDFFLPQHREKNILATTTNPLSLKVGDDLHFVRIPRRKLPQIVWRTTCSCPEAKTGARDNANCQLAWGESQARAGGYCYVRITRETDQRMNLAPAASDRCI